MPWQTYNTVKVFQCYHLPTPAPHFGGTVNKQPLMVSFSSLNHLPSPWFPCSMTEKVFYFVVLLLVFLFFILKNNNNAWAWSLMTPPPHDHFGLWCTLFYFAFCCHDWAFWPSTREGEVLFYLQLTVQQRKPRQNSRQELEASTIEEQIRLTGSQVTSSHLPHKTQSLGWYGQCGRTFLHS